MGIRGLKSFMKINRSFMQWQQLNDRKLVIDANNLFVTLYRDMYLRFDPHSANREDLYGGNLVAYAQLIRDFFQKLDRCNIKPVLVSDGMVSVDRTLSGSERSFLQAEAKAIERFRFVKTLSEGYRGERLAMSTCLDYVFKMVIEELEIEYVHTPYADKSFVARTANELKCPVASNDSIFVIIQVDEGMVYFDDITSEDLCEEPNRSDPENAKMVLNCPVFKRSKLLAQVPGLKPEMMPLLAGLIHSTYGNGTPLDHLVPFLNLMYYGKLSVKSYTHRKIANLLHWLAERESFEDAVKSLCKLDPSSKQTILESIEGFVMKESESHDIIKELELIYPPSDYFWTDESEQPAHYLSSLIRKVGMYPSLMDIIFQRPFFENAVIDDVQLPPSGIVRLRPMSVIVALLRPRSLIVDPDATSGDSMPAYHDKDDESCIGSSHTAASWKYDVYDRGNSYELTKCEVEPLNSLVGFGSLEAMHIGSVIHMDTDKKYHMMLATFRCNEKTYNQLGDLASDLISGSLKQDAQICFMLIRYCALQSKVKPSRAFVEAVVIVLLHYNKVPEWEEEIVKAQLAANTMVASYKMTHGKPQATFRRIMHLLSQLSVAFCSFAFLSNLLLNPIQVPLLHKYFDCPLVYRMATGLSLGDLNFCQELIISDAATLSDAIDNLIKLVIA